MARTKKTSEETTSTSAPKVFGWVAGKPAHLQEHPDNKKENK
jgi:hypothetical protein